MKIPETRQERRLLLKANLMQYNGKSFYCKALGCKVKVTDKFITETAYQGAISKQATKLALQLPEVIKSATIIQLHLPPKLGRQTKVMKFKEIANLCSEIPRVGKAKLTVGFVENDGYIEYSVTEYEYIK